MNYTFGQTFYVDPNAVSGSSEVFLTGVDLYFKKVPTANNNASGIVNPGVTVSIAKTLTNGAPDPSNVLQVSVVRLPYSSISVSNTAATATAFTFNSPIPVPSGKSYAILISFDDPGYQLWEATKGDDILGTTTVFKGVTGGFQGNLYDFHNSGTPVARNATDLKFRVRVAKFTANSATYELVSGDYEFVTYDTGSTLFKGGEPVFAKASAQTGTISVTAGSNVVVGTSTTFTSRLRVGGPVVWNQNSTVSIVRTVATISNNTLLTVTEPSPFTNASATYESTVAGKAYYQDATANVIFLSNSSANSSLYLQPGQILQGAISGATCNVVALSTVPVAQFQPEILMNLPPDGFANVTYDFASASGNTWVVLSNTWASCINDERNQVQGYQALMLSRSVEVVTANGMYGANAKSAVFKVAVGSDESTTKGVFSSPYIYGEKLDVFVGSYLINDDATGENTRYGNAHAKHLTTKITFATGLSAEDVLVYTTCFRPANTNVLAYAKVYNSKDPYDFDDKDWTPMVFTEGSNSFFSSNQAASYVELSYELPPYPPSLYTANGTATANGTNVLVGDGTNYGVDLVAGDLVKVYQALFPEDYQVSVVNAVANTTQLTLNDVVSNTSLTGGGLLVDKLTLKNTAFLNPQNSGVARYYNADLTVFDGFDSLQVKMVMLSTSTYVVPRIHDLRVLGVSS